jgi:hypothetical protein
MLAGELAFTGCIGAVSRDFAAVGVCGNGTVVKCESEPPWGVRNNERIVEAFGQARGHQVAIRSVHEDGIEQRTSVKGVYRLPLNQRLV